MDKARGGVVAVSDPLESQLKASELPFVSTPVGPSPDTPLTNARDSGFMVWDFVPVNKDVTCFFFCCCWNFGYEGAGKTINKHGDET